MQFHWCDQNSLQLLCTHRYMACKCKRLIWVQEHRGSLAGKTLPPKSLPPNMSSKANSAFHPSGVGKWVPASAGKAKAGMVHSVSGWTWGVQVKLWDPWECMPCLSALEVCSRQGIIQIHVYLTLPLCMAATILSWSEVPLHCWDCTVVIRAWNSSEEFW